MNVVIPIVISLVKKGRHGVLLSGALKMRPAGAMPEFIAFSLVCVAPFAHPRLWDARKLASRCFHLRSDEFDINDIS
jgi:hypothetical protein